MSIVEWSQDSINFLEKLNNEDSERIVRKIDVIKENPLRFIKGLINKDFGKIRIGDYRIFVDFIIREDRLVIRTIKHRKNAYKNE